MHEGLKAFLTNPIFWSAFFGWTAASCLKILSNLRQTGRIDFQYLHALGGMPSAHSAMVSSLAVAAGLREGFGSTVFAVALAFALVVMFDASTVRRATGLQARLLNQIVDDVYKHHHLSKEKLKDILGHTRMEVFAGMLVGIIVATIVHVIVR
jgi:acid phosphatase family membrane protein YuiD